MSDTQDTLSLPAQLSNLEVGGTVSKAVPIPPSELHTLNETKLAMRNNFSPAIRRARTRTGGEYTMETTETLMPSGNIYVIGIITRTA